MKYDASNRRYDTMIYNRCGKSGLMLPAISLGLWHNFGGTDVFENGRSIIRYAFDQGITHFDLANNYGPPPGSAEENFGKIMKLDLMSYRDELVVSTKAGYLMWQGPYGEWGSKNTSFQVWIKVSGVWVLTMLTFFIRIVRIRIHRLKKPCRHWITL